jgi:hypothetical protein
MRKFKTRKSLMNQRIPTYVGLLILVLALVSGVLFLGKGPGVFAPRANPQSQPKKHRLTNLTENSFTVSFYTDEKTTGFIKYGTDPKKLKSQASDDRDQLSGNVGKYHLHHITVRGVEPNTTYYYVLGTGSRAEFDNQGEPFEAKSHPKPNGSPPEARTVYGSVSTAGGTPAEGSIVYLSTEGGGDMSSLVKSSGSWAIPLSKARTSDGTDYAQIKQDDQIKLLIQGKTLPQTITYQTKVEEAQPVEELSFGSDPDSTAASESAQLAAGKESATPSAGTNLATPSAETNQATPSAETEQEETDNDEEAAATDSADTPDLSQSDQNDEEIASISGRLQELLEEAEQAGSTASATLSLADEGETQVATQPAVTNQSPQIIGKAKPNVEVKISIHSDNNIQSTVQADGNGQFALDLEELKKTLEPGEHTVTYSYIDPDTGEEVQKTETFWVEDPNAVQLAQSDSTNSNNTTDSTNDTYTDDSETDSDIPYGSGEPYPMNSPTPTISTPSLGTPSPTLSNRQEVVATDSTLQEAGSVGNTLSLIIGGMFFIFSGVWSWWLASELES